MNDKFEKVCSPEPCPDDAAADPGVCEHGLYYADCAAECHRTDGGAPSRDRAERGPFAHILGPLNAKMQHALRVRNIHLGVREVLAEVLAGADYRHPLADADPIDHDSMYRFVSNVLLHAHDRARADLPDVRKGPLRVAVVAPMWVTTALPWHRRDEVGRSANFEWVPLWEDPCAELWHLVALAQVDDGSGLPPSVLLDNYQWVGAYPAPTPHAGMGPHEPCGGAHGE